MFTCLFCSPRTDSCYRYCSLTMPNRQFSSADERNMIYIRPHVVIYHRVSIGLLFVLMYVTRYNIICTRSIIIYDLVLSPISISFWCFDASVSFCVFKQAICNQTFVCRINSFISFLPSLLTDTCKKMPAMLFNVARHTSRKLPRVAKDMTSTHWISICQAITCIRRQKDCLTTQKNLIELKRYPYDRTSLIISL